MRQPGFSAGGDNGFSLVEVTVAIGIFAFVAVAILGLLPAALKIRADSARETRAVMIAEELFSSVRSSPSITNVRVRVGPRNTEQDMRYNQNLVDTSVVLGYPVGTTVPFWFFQSPGAAWTNAGGANPEVLQATSYNAIETMARLSASAVSGTTNLYRVTVEVRSPAIAPGTSSSLPPVQFTTLYYSQ
ncbi:MAG: type IV pilus modification PilV family protein [Chthoniobacterales bacterium]|jgi:type II secretory pathway pseudopilin PulG